MNYKKALQEKIDKANKLIKKFKKMGINATLDEKTGEIEIHGSEFNKVEVIKRMSKL